MSVATAQGVTPRPRKRGNPVTRVLKNERVLLGFIGVFGFLVFWEIGGAMGIIDDAFFSRPSRIVAAGIEEVQKPRFWTDVQASMLEFSIGYILAIVLGIPLGLAAGWFRKLQWALDPWLNFFNSLPRVALLPILVIIFGLGLSSKIAVVFLGAFFSIIIPTLQGVRTVERRFLDVATSFRAPRGMLFTTVVAPSTVPFIITGMRLGMARALIGVVTGELYAATIGLGVMIRRAAEVREGDRMLFGVLIFTIAGIVGVELIRRIERRYQKWRPNTEVRR